MKAKILLTSMVLPALFAACTNDEIVENNGGSISGRKMFEPVGVTLAGDAQTRFEWNESNFGWNGFTAEDKFSAGLVDATLWTVDNKVMTNFVYSSADGQNFTTPSKMMEGVYFFYSYPEFEKLSNRSEVPFDLTATQKKVDLKDPVANVNASQLFVSPLYKVEAAQADASIPVTFRSYWSTAGLKIKNNSKTDMKVVRIVLSSSEEDFKVKGTLDLKTLGRTDKDNSKNTGLVYYYDASAGGYIFPYKDKDAGVRYDLQDFYMKDFATTTAEGQQKVIMVDVENGEVASGKDATAYIMVPAGKFTSISAAIYFEVKDENGVSSVKMLTKEFNKGYKDEEDKEWVRFRRGYTTAAFGTESGALKAYEITDIDIMTAGAGNQQYAASFEDLYKIVTEAANATEIKVYNVGSLKVDDNVVALMNRLTAGSAAPRNIAFQNPIAVTSESASVLSLSNIAFDGGATVEKGSFKLDAADIVETKTTMTVKEGAKVIVNATQAGTIANEGTVDITTDGAVTVSHAKDNSAVLNINKTTSVNATVSAKLVLTGTANPSEINVNGTENKPVVAVTFSKTEDLTSKLNINEYAKVDVAAGATLTLKGNVENYGTLEKGMGILNLKGFKSGTTNVIRNIDNYGVVDGVVLNKLAKITVKNAESETKNVSEVAAGDAGKINNTLGGYVTGESANTVVYAQYAGNQNGKLGAVPACDLVILNGGTWTAPALASTVTMLELNGVTLTNDNAITIGNVEKAVLKNCVVNKALTMDDAEELTLDGTTFNEDAQFNDANLNSLELIGVTMKKNFDATSVATVTVGKNTTKKEEASTTEVGGTFTTAATNFTVRKYGTLKVVADACVTTNATCMQFVYDGAVNNRGTIEKANVSGTGTWSGNVAEMPTLTGNVTGLVAGEYNLVGATNIKGFDAAGGVVTLRGAYALTIESACKTQIGTGAGQMQIVLGSNLTSVTLTGDVTNGYWGSTGTGDGDLVGVTSEDGVNPATITYSYSAGNTAVYTWDTVNKKYSN